MKKSRMLLPPYNLGKMSPTSLGGGFHSAIQWRVNPPLECHAILNDGAALLIEA